jgi:hypothetical protein
MSVKEYFIQKLLLAFHAHPVGHHEPAGVGPSEMFEPERQEELLQLLAFHDLTLFEII